MRKIKKRRLLSPMKFMSTFVYLLIILLLLLVLAYLYAQNELGVSHLLGTPLRFAVAIMLCGFIATGIYCCFGAAVNAIVVSICKRDTGIGGVLRLNNAETTLISIAACIGLGALFRELTLEIPDLAFFYQMLWSLPLGRLAFINTKPTDFFADCAKILSKARGTILYVMLYIAAMFIECYATLTVQIVFWCASGLLLVGGFLIRVPIQVHQEIEDDMVSPK